MRLSSITLFIFLSVSPVKSYDFVRHTENLDGSRFFDTKFISNYPAVKKVLLEEEGFAEVFFKTPAGHILQGLFRRAANPDFTIIFCSGFIPGKQEGIATFITMMPKNCNILFFNGHGKDMSTGKLAFMNLLYYGRYDYLDTIGAIEYAHFMHDGPLFIHGLCAGGFHASHALAHLQTKIDTYNIRGFICDSIWSAVDTITVGVVDDELTRATSHIKRLGLKAGRLFAHYIAAPLVRRYKHETNLIDKIEKITIPVLFIHSYDDTLTNIVPAQLLADKVSHKQCWWIEEPSKHACHHLKHKYQYAQKLADFLSAYL